MKGYFMYYNEKIEYIRTSKNIPQKELAQHLGIKQQQLHDMKKE